MVQTTTILTTLQRYFRSEPRIDHAWLFGSFARGDSSDSSDVDVMVEMQSNKRYTLFDLFGLSATTIAHEYFGINLSKVWVT